MSAPPAIDESKLQAVADFMSKLTLQRVCLLLLLVVGAIMAYALFEQRANAYETVSGSTPMMVVLLCGLGLIVIGMGVSGLVRYVDSQRDTVYRTLRDQIVDLRQALAAVEARERECQSQRDKDRYQMQELMVLLAKAGVLVHAAP